MTAAAPAVGTAKIRFIPAPSRESLGSAAGRGWPRARPVWAGHARPAYIRTGMFSCWQPRGNIRVDPAAAMSPMSRLLTGVLPGGSV